MARKARVEGAAAIVGYPAADDLSNIVEAFKAAYPEDWEKAHLGPLCDGLNHMIAKLRS